MNCPHCQKPIDTDSAFCKYCGQPVQQNSPSPSGPSGIGWKSGLVAFIILLIVFLLFLLFMKPATA